MAGMDLRTELAESLAAAEAKGEEFYRGADWWQLSGEERSVFGINPVRWPRLMQAWSAFEHFMGVVSGGDGPASEEAFEAARMERFEIRSAAIDGSSFAEFCRAFTDLTLRECDQMYTKHHFWLARQGLITYPDEEGFTAPPP